MRIGISGGAPVALSDVLANPWGLSWEADGTMLFGQTGEGIYRISENGGTPELIIPVDEGIVYGPQLLPDGDSVLFSVGPRTGKDRSLIVAQSLLTGERTVLVQGGYDARYVPTGHIVYALWRCAFCRRVRSRQPHCLRRFRTARAGSAAGKRCAIGGREL